MSLERAFCSAVERCNMDIHKIVDTYIDTRTNDILPYIKKNLIIRQTFKLTDIISNEELADLQDRILAVVHNNIKFLSMYNIPVKSFNIENTEFDMININEILQEFVLTGKIINLTNQVGSKCYEALLGNLLKIEILNSKKIGKDLWYHVSINNYDNSAKIEQMLRGIMKNIKVLLLNHYTYKIADYLYARYDDIIFTEDNGTPLTA